MVLLKIIASYAKEQCTYYLCHYLYLIGVKALLRVYNVRQGINANKKCCSDNINYVSYTYLY